MLVADQSVDYTPTPSPQREHPETETPFEKGRMERMGRSTSRMPEDIPQPPSKRLKVTTPRSTLFEPELVAPPVNRLRAIMENSHHTPLALTGQFRAAVQSRRFQQRAAEPGAIGTQLRAAVHSRRFQQRGIQARAAAEAAEKEQRRARTAQEIAGEQQRALARESKLDRALRESEERTQAKLKQHEVASGIQPLLPTFEPARPSTPHDPMPGVHTQAVDVHDDLMLQRMAEAKKQIDKPPAYLKPSEVFTFEEAKRQEREAAQATELKARQKEAFERTQTTREMEHRGRVKAKTRLQLRMPLKAISPIRDLGSSALRPGMAVAGRRKTFEVGPAGGWPVFRQAREEMEAARLQDARKISLAALQGGGFGAFQHKPEETQTLPQDPTAGKRVMPIRQHTEQEMADVLTGLGKIHISPPKTVESGPVTVESPFPEPEEKMDTTEAEMSEFEEAETVQMGSETPTVQYTASVTGAPTIMTATPP